MKGTVHKFPILLMAVLALALLSAGVYLLSGSPSTVRAEGLPAPLMQNPDNSQCLGCHSASDQVYQFPNGDTVSISVDGDVYGHGAHSGLACQVCHSDITGYPHPDVTAQTAREYTIEYKNTCNQCHPNQAKELNDSAHAKLAQSGNPNTPICADCHDPHSQDPIEKNAEGDPAPSEHAAIADTCSKCHSGIVEQYRTSVHGAGVFEENNLDVPACNDCHGIHKIETARSAEFRLNSPQLCASCHSRADIMDKYGISTNVLNTYVADFHGTTVTLFEKTSPEMETNKPVCYDCHGVHNILRVDDPERGLEIKENMLTTCQKCHPDASENFPASWMSHYNATPTRFPLVYYVQLFYKIFIPAVLGGMGLFVLSDILHRAGILGRKPKTQSAAGKATKE